MPKKRILVVHSESTARKSISAAVTLYSGMDVGGVAATGSIALKKLVQVNPEAIAVHVELDDMHGFEFIQELRTTHTFLPVLMFGKGMTKGSLASLDAIAAGANACSDFPPVNGYEKESKEMLSSCDFISKLKECMKNVVVEDEITSEMGFEEEAMFFAPMLPTQETVVTAAPQSSGIGKIEMLCIGSSTGGPDALVKLFKKLPKDFPVPIVMVQHMPPMFTGMLADRLTTLGTVPVKEAEDGDIIKPSHAYLAPGGMHMAVKREGDEFVARLNFDPPENSCRPAVDPMLRSAVRASRDRLLTVILTGMGSDGTRGCEYVREAGGEIIVQDEETSIVWGMPGFVADAGMAEAILPIEEISREIVKRICKSNNLKVTDYLN